MKFEMPRQIFQKKQKNIEISNFTKIRREGAESFHADGRTEGESDKTTSNSRFLKVCERTW